VSAINIESAVREGSSSLNININDPQVVFLLTGQRVAQTETTITYKIGDKGPGGGFIFFAENDVYMECSMDIGSSNWDNAEKMAKNYRGGGLTDWRLPTIGELNLMYKNLKQKGLAGFSDSSYWFSTTYSSNSSRYYGFDFSSGYQRSTDNKNPSFSVRAVRSF
jgi:hypothetical protein